MKLNKSILSIIVLSFSAVMLMTVTGCEGPEGPAGVDGVDGIAGIDGVDGLDGADITDASCLRCHADNQLVIKRYQLDQHDHSTLANSISRGTSASCGRCHSHQGFVELLDTGESSSRDTATPLTCNTCHTLHNTTEVDSFSFDQRVTGSIEFLTGNIETFGDDAVANTCLQCHQPRRTYEDYDDTPADAADSVSLTSSHAGPHYGITGSLIFGKGADDRNGTVALDQGEMLHATATCVTCHMGENKNHNFEPEVENCQSCHSGAEDFDMNGTPTKIHDAVHAIELEFVTLGALKTTDSLSFSQTASRDIPTVLSGVQFSAFWNYQVLHGDHGSTYHNPPYVKAIINNIEENLGMTQTSW